MTCAMTAASMSTTSGCSASAGSKTSAPRSSTEAAAAPNTQKNPQYLAENLLDRKFYAEKPNEKWLTDVTEFKWYEGNEIHKLYLSAILDLCDRRIVSYVLSEHNDNPLAFKTFDKAVQAIRTCILCSTATEGFSTPTAPSTTSLCRLG